jgi:hypothetical protein
MADRHDLVYAERIEQIEGATSLLFDRILSGRQCVAIAETDGVHGDGPIAFPEQRQRVAELVLGTRGLVQEQQRLALAYDRDIMRARLVCTKWRSIGVDVLGVIFGSRGLWVRAISPPRSTQAQCSQTC